MHLKLRNGSLWSYYEWSCGKEQEVGSHSIGVILSKKKKTIHKFSFLFSESVSTFCLGQESRWESSSKEEPRKYHENQRAAGMENCTPLHFCLPDLEFDEMRTKQSWISREKDTLWVWKRKKGKHPSHSGSGCKEGRGPDVIASSQFWFLLGP